MKRLLLLLLTAAFVLSPYAAHAGAPQQVLLSIGAPASGGTPTPSPTATPPSGPVLVQDAVNRASGVDTVIVSMSGAVTAGDFVIVKVIYDPLCSLGTPNNSIIDVNFQSEGLSAVGGNLPALLTSGGLTGNGIAADMWFIDSSVGHSAGRQVVVTLASASDVTASVEVWHFPVGTPAVEDTAATAGAIDNAPYTGTVTPSSATNVVFAVYGAASDSYSSGPTNGFTRQTPWTSSAPLLESADLVQSSATAQSTAWSLTTFADWVGAIAVLGAP